MINKKLNELISTEHIWILFYSFYATKLDLARDIKFSMNYMTILEVELALHTVILEYFNIKE